jgi:hypothetical protein
MIRELVKLANHLDGKGLVKEADYLDRIIKSSTDVTEQNASIPLMASRMALENSGDQELLNLVGDLEEALLPHQEAVSALAGLVSPSGDQVLDIGGEVEYRPQTVEDMSRFGTTRDNIIYTILALQALKNNNGDAETTITSLGLTTDVSRHDSEWYKHPDSRADSSKPPSPESGAFSDLFGGADRSIALSERIMKKDPALIHPSLNGYEGVLDLDHPDFKGMFKTKKEAWKFARTFETVTKHFRWGKNIFLVKWK